MLYFEHGLKQRILTLKMAIERPLRDTGRRGYLVDINTGIPALSEENVGRIHDACPCLILFS